MINLNDIKIIKLLGNGIRGNIYLCEYNNKKYALKIIKASDNNNFNYENEICREIDLLKYINSMKKKYQKFFTKLYGYSIINNIEFNSIYNNNKQIIIKDNADFYIVILMEYKGNKTLFDFFYKKYIKNINVKYAEIYTIILQVIHILILLQKSGYSHNDTHLQNIMIKKTNKKYYKMNNIKINYNGYLVSIIDYGNTLHEKFNLKNNNRYLDFIKYNNKWFNYQIIIFIIWFISGLTYVMFYSVKKYNIYSHHKLNWLENGFRQILNNHIEFYNKKVNKYILIYPDGKRLLELFFLNKNTNKTHKEIFDTNDYIERLNYDCIISRIIVEFSIEYPALSKKYFEFLIEPKPLLPKSDILNILLLVDVDNIISFIISKT